MRRTHSMYFSYGRTLVSLPAQRWRVPARSRRRVGGTPA